jgi:AcrR family transcriptional regulator
VTAAEARLSKSERTRRQILAAAERRFAAAGFERTRLEDVGADAGIAGSAILYHFQDKRELYRAVLDELFSGLLGSVQHAARGSGPLGERIEGAVRAAVRWIAAHPAAAGIALREAASDDRELHPRALPFLRLIGALFEEGARSGAIQPVRADPFHFISAVAGLVLFYVAALPRFVEDLPPDHLVPERMEALERDAVTITRRLLGLGGPRPIRRRKE